MVSALAAALPLEAVVRARLAEVDDPEIPGVSIVDLGIVHDVRVSASPSAIRVELLPTFVGCPALEMMRDAVAGTLAGLADDVHVNFTFAEPWTAARITAQGRAGLAARGFAPPEMSFESVDSESALPVLPIATVPVLRFAPRNAGERLRPDALPGDLLLRRLPPAVRAVQVGLTEVKSV